MSASRRPTAYIHIGPHKTGSSSIKHFVRANRETLAGRGLFFPLLIGANGKPARNHEDLGKAPEIGRNGDLKPDARLWPEIEAIAAKGEMDVLLSSEMFSQSFLTFEMFPRILAYFQKRGYRVVILAYVRDQPGWLNSKYVQSQKRFSRNLAFERFCAKAEENGSADPWRFLKRFIDEPGCELEVISFERAIASGLELDFVRRCGIPADVKLEAVTLRNPNVGAKSVYAAQEIMRRAGPRLMRLQGYGLVYNIFKRRCQEMGFDKTPFVALDQKIYERIRAHYAATNESFAKAYFGTSWTELCPPRTYTPSIFDPAQASRQELNEIEDLVATIVRKLSKLEEKKGKKFERDMELAD